MKSVADNYKVMIVPAHSWQAFNDDIVRVLATTHVGFARAVDRGEAFLAAHINR